MLALERVSDGEFRAVLEDYGGGSFGGDTLGRLVRASRAQSGRAIASAYAGGIGVPAILPRRLWRSAMRLTGDVGARKLLAAEHVVRVALPEAELDVDTAEDLAKL